MRAGEFIFERKIGDITKRRRFPTVGLNKFRDREFADRVYELNRVMMAAASTDGTFVPDIDSESWAGRHDIAAPYTKAEQEMLNKAYQATGSWSKDLNSGDLRSQEIPTVNRQSPINGFKGY